MIYNSYNLSNQYSLYTIRTQYTFYSWYNSYNHEEILVTLRQAHQIKNDLQSFCCHFRLLRIVLFRHQ